MGITSKSHVCLCLVVVGWVGGGGPRVTHHSECGVKFQANTQEIQEGPMETIRDPIRNHKGIPWEPQAKATGNVRKSHGKCNKNPQGHQWESNGNTMGNTWKSNGDPMGIQR